MKTEKTVSFSVQNYIRSLQQTFLRIWLGATDKDVESAFRWTDGSIVSWVNWDTGHPAGTTGAGSEKDCLVRNGNEGKWVDNNCADTKKFYCETVEGE